MRALARPITVIALAVLLPATAGCGTADREADVAAVTDRFHAAVKADDGSGACAELGSETIKKLEQQEKRPCPQAILELDLPPGARTTSADVYITSAYADLGKDHQDDQPHSMAEMRNKSVGWVGAMLAVAVLYFGWTFLAADFFLAFETNGDDAVPE